MELLLLVWLLFSSGEFGPVDAGVSDVEVMDDGSGPPPPPNPPNP